MIHEEVWRPIEGFPDYEVSNLGRVIHIDRPNTPRSTKPNHKGFPTLVLFNKEHSGTRYLRQLNSLVAKAFIGPPPPRMDSVWHIDGDLMNCQADNLKWDMRARVLEWNEMHRTLTPTIRTPRVLVNATGQEFENAFECAMAVGDIESAVATHIEKYPPQYADRAKYRYI